jgi:hypothetical protein
MRAGDAERVREFCTAVWSETVRRSGRAILDLALGPVAGGEALLDAVCGGAGGLGLAQVMISPRVPVVAVGGPVKVYYGEVGRRLGCEVVFPPFCEVANAVGAATGVVSRVVDVAVEGDGSGIFRVHTPAGVEIVTSPGEALARAEDAARQLAQRQAEAAGAADPELHVAVEKHLLPDAVDDSGLFRAVVSAEAIGRPNAAH